MLKKLIILQLNILVGFFLLMSETALAGSSGSGGLSSSKKVMAGTSTNKSIVLKNKNTNLETTIRNARKHPLARPSSFLKDGVYIWCDPDDIWTVFWRSKENKKIFATLTAEHPIEIIAASGSLKVFDKSDTNQIILNTNIGAQQGVIQFKSANSTEFNVLIDNKVDTQNIFIGSLIENPKGLPFSLTSHTQTTKNSANSMLQFSSPKGSQGGFLK